MSMNWRNTHWFPILQNRLHGRGQKASLVKQEIDMIGCLTLDDSITPLKDDLIKIFQLQHKWQCDLEKALEDCGINVKVSDDGKYLTVSEDFSYL